MTLIKLISTEFQMAEEGVTYLGKKYDMKIK